MIASIFFMPERSPACRDDDCSLSCRERANLAGTLLPGMLHDLRAVILHKKQATCPKRRHQSVTDIPPSTTSV
ncbi:MAG: hypothetical protein KDH19_09615, partial [Geminicoccaceae bacterium]|nr:hypothetical protein [Geminicoccaceae bacterium]